MGVQSSADRIIQNIENAFAAISDKGGTVPASKVSGNLASAINSIPTGGELPELSNPGTEDDLIYGKELIGQNGEKITGNVQMVQSGNTGLLAPTSDVSFVKYNYGDYINMMFRFPSRIAFDAQSALNVQSNAVNFGDATEADVTAGKTFTSASGLRKVGTKANTGGGGEDLDSVLTEQEELIARLKEILDTKASGGASAPATIGENLHDVSTDFLNTFLSGGSISSYTGWTSTDYIPVEAGKCYLAYSISSISAQYCSQFDTNKTYIRSFSGIMNCTDKDRPVFIEGHEGYVRFSGTAAQIAALEFYEVLNFKWELPAGLSRSIEEYPETAGEPNDE